MPEIKYHWPLILTLLAALWGSAGPGCAGELVEATGVTGGLVVHVGCGDGALGASLRAGDGYLVQGLDMDPASVDKARGRIKSLSLYGKVTADTFDGKRLPYTDNLVNLLVVSDPYDVPQNEMMRVLAPRGVALIAEDRDQGAEDRNRAQAAGVEKVEMGGRTWTKLVKPWPEEIDQWTHYLHGPDNNAVAHDTVVGPPRHMQWLASPRWARNHHILASISAVVTAEGRLFYIVDEATSANVNVPGKWVILARDAFSGVTLWKKPMRSWAWHRIRFRSGPPQVTRLLVASGDRVYVPLGLSAPVSVLDAATGQTLSTFEATGGAEEIVLAGGVLLVLKGSPVAEQAFAYPAFQGQYELPNEKTLVALDARSGKTLWTWSDPVARPMPETLASDGKRAYVQIDEGVACLDLKSGEALWTYGERAPRAKKGEPRKKGARPRVSFGTNTLVVADDVVLANLSGNLTALAADDGKKLWQCPAGGGFHSPLDIFVIGGLVWQGSHVPDSVAPPPWHDFSECRDLHTGEVRGTNTVMVDLQTSGHHHRCYREKATDRFIITGKRGVEMMDLVGTNHSRNNWVRGGCQYGILPANGLLYAPSHACGCYMESKLRGFWALAPERDEGREMRHQREASARLQRGPAYGQQSFFTARGGVPEMDRSACATPRALAIGLQRQPAASSQHSDDWPMYRHDPLRSGASKTVVPAELRRVWKTGIGGRLTQPVVAGAKLLVAAVDENTVYCLDETSGSVLWTHVAGGRVDSPPAVFLDHAQHSPRNQGRGVRDSGFGISDRPSEANPESLTPNPQSPAPQEGLVLFGSADGRVTCLRLSDGELVWRFLAAPADLRTVAFDQVESLWPVHGSVLVLDGVVYCSAGRSTWLDGGIDLLGLDPATGKVVSKAHFESRHPVFREGKDQAKPEYETRIDQNTTDYKTFLAPDQSDSFSMAGGAVSDVLTSDGRNVFLHHVKFNARLEKQDEMSRHLFSTSSLLDDAENHRSHWVLGTGDFSRIPVAYSWVVNRPGTRMPTIAVPTGVMMVFDDHAVWGVQRQGDATGKYSLVKKENRPFSEQEAPLPDFRRMPIGEADQYLWKHDLPERATAMLKSADHLFLGVMPVEIPEDDPHAAYEGRLGGSLWVCSETDGSRLAQYELPSPVVWDGMAAADGKLFLSTSDGSVQSFAAAR